MKENIVERERKADRRYQIEAVKHVQRIKKAQIKSPKKPAKLDDLERALDLADEPDYEIPSPGAHDENKPKPLGTRVQVASKPRRRAHKRWGYVKEMI